MNNENLNLLTFGYNLEIGVEQLIDFAFNKADGLDMKECLLGEMEYNQEPFIERLEEDLGLPVTKEAEEVYYGISADEWRAILNVKFDREFADIRDIDDGRGGDGPTVTVNADITVNTALLADICKEHGLEITYNKITLDMLKPDSEYGEIVLIPNDDAFIYTDDEKSINAEYECWFDVDKVFGTDTKGHDDRTVDFYTDYYPEDGHMLATVVVKDSNGGDTDFNYDLSDKEKEFLLDMMEKEAKREGYESLIDMWQKETGRNNPEMEK